MTFMNAFMLSVEAGFQSNDTKKNMFVTVIGICLDDLARR